jgi:hypothetical protein
VEGALGWRRSAGRPSRVTRVQEAWEVEVDYQEVAVTRERFSVDYAVAIAVFDHPSRDPGNSASPRLNREASHPNLNWNSTWQSAKNFNTENDEY